ncbi:MAG: ribonuclease, partial [Acidobacteria bacterium]|nr:ribonuclease [Acidobacteriota bacterium]
MSKELVISSNRRETKVAVLEDDQVVEVYFQRENEYSLAGSIHKGRVTRVLPGMQSAFVDLGLERDAFLYVSDFFEDHEEYDKIVSSVEEKILRLEKNGPAVLAATAAQEVPAPPPVAEAQQVAAETPVMAQRQPPAEERNPRDHDRRGRRSRRRRGGPKGPGRGLPESKFFNPAREERASGPAASVPAGESVADEDMVVLPGESLAKYRGREQSEGDDVAPYAGASFEDAEPDEGGEPEGVDAAESEALDTESHFSAEAEAAAEVAETAEDIEAPAIAEASEAVTAEDVQPALVRESAEPEPLAMEAEAPPAPEAETAAAENDAVEGIESETPETVAAEAEAAEAEGSGAAVAETEEPEPARIITSLTATLREQGPRYLHRVSRRMRRKARGEFPAEQQPQRSAQPPRQEQARVAARPAETGKGEKQPLISDLLREGQEIIVQIAKEPLGQKGARITSHTALPGRFLVYMRTVDHIG